MTTWDSTSLLPAVFAQDEESSLPQVNPFLLACVFRAAALTHLSDEAATRAFHLLCAGITTVLLRRLARRLWSSREALAVALAWITYPPALWLTRQPSSELPFLIPFFGAALFLTLTYAFTPRSTVVRQPIIKDF